MRDGPKPLWKLTIYTGSLAAWHFGKPHEQVRVYGSRWRGRLGQWAAEWSNLGSPYIHTRARLEPYWPASNVIAFPKAA